MANTTTRDLTEILEYRDLLNAKDDVMKVVGVLTADNNASVTATSTVTVKSDKTNIASPAFNKYLNEWIIRNIKLIAPEIVELLDNEIIKNRTEAEEEAGLLGLTTNPIIPPAPVISSSLQVSAFIGQDFEYVITAENGTVGNGVTFAEYFVTGNLPDWLRFDKINHKLTGYVPTSAIANNRFKVDLMVSTNVGIDSKTLIITYIDPESVQPDPENIHPHHDEDDSAFAV